MDEATSSYPVHLGVWTNWARGRVMGSTLTLTRSDGALLIAFVAFFVTITGTQLWRILCFILHGNLSTGCPQDALHNQRQVVLRNSTTPLGSIWVLMQMAHAWTGSEKDSKENKLKSLTRLLPLVLGTFLVAIGLAAATGLSSRIAQSGNEVLIDGFHCGRVDLSDNLTAIALLGAPYTMRDIVMGADYAQRCYESASASNECSTLLRRSLPIHVTSNASCPFDRSVCLSQDANIIVDSGLMDSYADLGLNWPPKDRFRLQTRWHCAPLVTDGYSSEHTFENRTFVRYQYGHLNHMASDCNCTLALSNATLNDASMGRHTPFMEPAVDFRLFSTTADFFHGTVKNTSIISPIPQLGTHGGDLNLIFLMGNSKAFVSRSEDLWYRASTPVSVITEFGEAVEIYAPDEPAWPMGCVSQYQFCKGGLCSGLGSLHDTMARLETDLVMASSFLGRFSYLNMLEIPSTVIYSLGAGALAATLKGATTLQLAPRRNDWHRDVKHWFATTLATMQFRLASIATGPDLLDFPGLSEYVRTAPSNETQSLCHSQIIRSTDYTSFSMFWLMFVLVAGIIIVLISVNMEPIAAVFLKWLSQSDGYAPLEWRANHALHLQRLAYEQPDTRDWVQGRWDIPITTADVKLPAVEEDQGLPRFRTCADEGSLEQGIAEGSHPTDEEAVAVKIVPQVNVDENRVSLSDSTSSAERTEAIASAEDTIGTPA